MPRSITPQEAYGLLQDGDAILIDVREADEFRSGHIPYAMSIPLAGVADDVDKLKLPQSKKVIFQCLKGKRGEIACDKVCSKDTFEHEIYNITGGIDAWEKAGLPLVGKGSGRLSIFRQVQIILGALLILTIGAGIGGSAMSLYVALLLSIAFFIAGVTGFCGLALVLSKMPWNK